MYDCFVVERVIDIVIFETFERIVERNDDVGFEGSADFMLMRIDTVEGVEIEIADDDLRSVHGRDAFQRDKRRSWLSV